jgi:hypothetical protein
MRKPTLELRASGRSGPPSSSLTGSNCGRFGLPGADVIVMVAVLHPLPDVARHVVKAECVGREQADGRGLQIAPLAAAAVAVREIAVNVLLDELA